MNLLKSLIINYIIDNYYMHLILLRDNIFVFMGLLTDIHCNEKLSRNQLYLSQLRSILEFF